MENLSVLFIEDIIEHFIRSNYASQNVLVYLVSVSLNVTKQTVKSISKFCHFFPHILKFSKNYQLLLFIFGKTFFNS